ncbi:MAG: hypothetical protein MJ239_02950 [Bacilli bacterium]|nr:hypothetical protein [Bacilli bacterium]
MKKAYFLLTASLLLASCGGTSSSSGTIFDPTSTFETFRKAGETYAASASIGGETDNFSLFFKGTSIGEEGESKISLEATNIKASGKLNNIRDENAQNLMGALVFQEGSMSVDAGIGEPFSVTRLRPSFYLKDYTTYIDLSENGIVRLTLNALVNALQPVGSTMWTFPARGKGYREIEPHSTLDNAMPFEVDSSSYVAWADALKDNYESYSSCFTFTLTKESNSIVFASKDKETLQNIVLDQFDKSSGDIDPEEKEKNEKAIKDFFEAANVKSFELGFGYNESVWTSRSVKIDVEMDRDVQKKNNPDASFYLDDIKVKGDISLLSGESAAITFPKDLGKKGESDEYKYERIPDIDLGSKEE